MALCDYQVVQWSIPVVVSSLQANILGPVGFASVAVFGALTMT
jgi:hypothetical protein